MVLAVDQQFVLGLTRRSGAVCDRGDIYERRSIAFSSRYVTLGVARDGAGLVQTTFPLLIVMIFGVMGFGSNLFFRVIWLYCEWQEGNEIDWARQIMLTFLVPGAYILVLLEIMAITGVIFIP